MATATDFKFDEHTLYKDYNLQTQKQSEYTCALHASDCCDDVLPSQSGMGSPASSPADDDIILSSAGNITPSTTAQLCSHY